MLNNTQIVDAINKNEIQIFYSFYFDEEKKLVEKEVNFKDSKFISNLYSDRLKLTMGPIVRILNKQSYNSKHMFKNSKDCVDLRKTSNYYIVKPKESIIILTNERISLNGCYSALIFPRISLSDVGIVVTPAYIDPFYNGILRLHVTNHSENPFELRTLEAIAQCFFFKFTDKVPKEYKDTFAHKSVFYGQNWNAIINEDRLPFPTKKNAKSNNEILDNLKYQFGILKSFIKKHSLLIIILTNCGLVFAGYQFITQTFEKHENLLEQLSINFDSAATEIIINPGEQYGEKEVILEIKKEDILTILCNNDLVQYKINTTNNESQSKIVFMYSMKDTTNHSYELDFTYTVIRRVIK